MMPTPITNINMDHTINSGQVFLWTKEQDKWYGIDGQDILCVDKTSRIESYHNRDGSHPKTDFFRQRDNITKIIKSISEDDTISDAANRYHGLRLVEQDPFQCLITFITSANSSIPRIKGCLRKITTMFGQKVTFQGKEFCMFPEPKTIAGATIQQIAQCGVGYRARFILDAAKRVNSGLTDIYALKDTSYHDAKEELLLVPGVGNKVADCIMLFSLDKLEAFPLDRWVVRVLERHYSGKFIDSTWPPDTPLTKRRYEKLHEEVVQYFGPYAGYAQQFLFKMERDRFNMSWLKTGT